MQTQKAVGWSAVFRDVQFWVPLVVLLIGLLLLGLAR
jgi:hypothetical protein